MSINLPKIYQSKNRIPDQITCDKPVIIINSKPKEVSDTYTKMRCAIAWKLGVQNKNHYQRTAPQWGNSALSVQELLEDAQFFSHSFIQLAKDSCYDIKDAKVNCGPNNCYMIKSETSLRRKVNALVVGAKDVGYKNANEKHIVQKSITDCVRGSIIVDNVNSAKEVVLKLEENIKGRAWSYTLENKWNNKSVSGYVGIHFLIQLVDKTRGRYLIGEVQVHFSQVFDGTMQCPKNISHLIYEYTRDKEVQKYISTQSKETRNFFAEVTKVATKAIFLNAIKNVALKSNL